MVAINKMLLVTASRRPEGAIAQSFEDADALICGGEMVGN